MRSTGRNLEGWLFDRLPLDRQVDDNRVIIRPLPTLPSHDTHGDSFRQCGDITYYYTDVGGLTRVHVRSVSTRIHNVSADVTKVTHRSSVETQVNHGGDSGSPVAALVGSSLPAVRVGRCLLLFAGSPESHDQQGAGHLHGC